VYSPRSPAYSLFLDRSNVWKAGWLVLQNEDTETSDDAPEFINTYSQKRSFSMKFYCICTLEKAYVEKNGSNEKFEPGINEGDETFFFSFHLPDKALSFYFAKPIEKN